MVFYLDFLISLHFLDEILVMSPLAQFVPVQWNGSTNP